MNETKKAIIIMFLLLLLSSAGVQAAEEEKPKGWTGDTSLSLGVTRGNTDTTTFSLSANLKTEWSKVWSLEKSASLLMTRVSGETTGEKMGLTSRIRYSSSDRFFIFGEVQALRDRFKNHSYRFIPQLGGGFVAFKTDNMSLDFTSGLTQVFTRYHQTAENDSYTGFALGNIWKWKISETAEFLESLSYNTNFANLSRFFMRLEISLTTALTKLFSIKLTLIDSYDNKPIGVAIKKNDFTLLAGLSMKF